MHYKYIFTLITILAVLLPGVSRAEKVVSQTFPEDTTYFDVGTKQHYMSVAGNMYESSTYPDVAQIWSFSGQTIDFGDDLDHDFLMTNATTFNDAAYITVESTEYAGETTVALRQEVWKFTAADDQFTLERVYSETDDLADGYNQLRSLFVFNDRLYLVTADNKIYTTKSGDQWHKMKHDLPKDVDYTFYPAADHIYAGAYGTDQTQATLYSSSKGKRWSVEKGGYRDSLDSAVGVDTVGITSITGSDTRLYIKVKTAADWATVWTKNLANASAKWKSVLEVDRIITTMTATNDEVAISFDNGTSQYIQKCSETLVSCETVWNDYSATVTSSMVSRNHFLYWISDGYDENYLLSI